MSFKTPSYACTACGFPAKNTGVFVNDVSPYGETLDCPKCGGESKLLET